MHIQFLPEMATLCSRGTSNFSNMSSFIYFSELNDSVRGYLI